MKNYSNKFRGKNNKEYKKKFNNRFLKIKIITIRLPKLKTDQTSEIITSFKNENIKIMVPIIRSIISKNL